MLEPMQEAENWVVVAFLLFIALLFYLGVHRKIAVALDQRQGRIKGELDEARRLREEAQALLAEFERKGREAEGEAAAIIAGAKAEAEAQALADVRSAAADAAVAAAEKILAAAAKGKVAENLLAQGIEDVRKKFN